jgi:hypothetical protein
VGKEKIMTQAREIREPKGKLGVLMPAWER